MGYCIGPGTQTDGGKPDSGEVDGGPGDDAGADPGSDPGVVDDQGIDAGTDDQTGDPGTSSQPTACGCAAAKRPGISLLGIFLLGLALNRRRRRSNEQDL
jgi:uncharacterized protein (TIGR03382 family)